MTPWVLSATGADDTEFTLQLPVQSGEGASLSNAFITDSYYYGGGPFFPTELKLTVVWNSDHRTFTLTPAGYGLTDVTASDGANTITFKAHWPEMVDRAVCLMPAYTPQVREDGSLYWEVTNAKVTLGLAYWETWRGMQVPRWDWPGAASRNQRFGSAAALPTALTGPNIMGWHPMLACTDMPDGGYAFWSYMGAELGGTGEEYIYGRKLAICSPTGVKYASNPFGYASMADYPGWDLPDCQRNVLPRLARNGTNLVSIGWNNGWLEDGFSGERLLIASTSAAWDVTTFEDGSYAVWVFEPGSLTLYKWTPREGVTTVDTYTAPLFLRRLRASRSGMEYIAWYVADDGLCNTKGGRLIEANRSLVYGLYELPQGDYLVAAKWHSNATAWAGDEYEAGVEGVLNAMLVTPYYKLIRTDGSTAKVVDSYADSSNVFMWYNTTRCQGL